MKWSEDERGKKLEGALFFVHTIISLTNTLTRGNMRKWRIRMEQHEWLLGKRRGENVHSVFRHCIDVANCCDAMLRSAWFASAVDQIGWHFRISKSATIKWVAFFAGLHDIGKLSLSFQMKIRNNVALKNHGVSCPVGFEEQPHNLISAKIVKDLLSHSGWNRKLLSNDLCGEIAAVLGGHHGYIPQKDELNKVSEESIGKEPLWHASHVDLLNLLSDLCGITSRTAVPKCRKRSKVVAFSLLTGVVSVSDWIGSSFDCDMETSPEEYIEVSKKCAERWISSLGFH